MVICNGGSATVYQALAESRAPVLGIPSNMDQHLTMQCVEGAEAGLSLRTEEVPRTPRNLTPRYAEPYPNLCCSRVRAGWRRPSPAYPAGERFAAFVGETVGNKKGS